VDACPFCALDPTQVWIEYEHALAVPDACPIADGHTVVIPRRHVSAVYELGIPEQQALWDLVGEVRGRLLIGLTSDGFSIGFSDTMHNGVSAHHAVVHVGPRHRGDSPDFPVGIEWVTNDHMAAFRK